jgi:hypothetical protein
VPGKIDGCVVVITITSEQLELELVSGGVVFCQRGSLCFLDTIRRARSSGSSAYILALRLIKSNATMKDFVKSPPRGWLAGWRAACLLIVWSEAINWRCNCRIAPIRRGPLYNCAAVVCVLCDVDSRRRRL